MSDVVNVSFDIDPAHLATALEYLLRLEGLPEGAQTLSFSCYLIASIPGTFQPLLMHHSWNVHPVSMLHLEVFMCPRLS